MVKCPKCNAEIKYIPTREGVTMVDENQTEIVTLNGRMVKGYQPHKCTQEKNNGKKEG